MTLKSMCQDALREIGEFEVPSSFIGSNNRTSIQILALARREGRTLSRRYTWQNLVKEQTFTTTAAETQVGAIPTDFRFFINMTFWNRTTQFRLNGPTTANSWQALESGLTSTSGTRYWVRRRNNDLLLHPDPPAGDTIAYEYMSNAWVDTTGDGEGDASNWAGDSDTTILDEEIFQMGIVWRFLKAKGLPYIEEYQEHQYEIMQAIARDKGRTSIVLAQHDENWLIGWDNVPDTGIGS